MEKTDKHHKTGAVNAVLAFGATAIASTVSMWASIRHYAYKNMRDTAFADIYKNRKEEEAALIKNSPDYLNKYGEVMKRYSKNIDERYAHIGVRSSTVLGSWDKFRKCLSGFEKSKVIGSGLIVCSVALGTYFNISQKRQIAEQLRRIDSGQPLHSGPAK